jgi:hypothetical protein
MKALVAGESRALRRRMKANSDDAIYITGTELAIDGGYLAR